MRRGTQWRRRQITCPSQTMCSKPPAGVLSLVGDRVEVGAELGQCRESWDVPDGYGGVSGSCIIIFISL